MEIIVIGLCYCVLFVMWITYSAVVYCDGIIAIITRRKRCMLFITFGTFLRLIESLNDMNASYEEIYEFVYENLTYERP